MYHACVLQQVYGDEGGQHLCFWFHGTPSCRLEAQGLDGLLLKELGIKARGAMPFTVYIMLTVLHWHVDLDRQSTCGKRDHGTPKGWKNNALGWYIKLSYYRRGFELCKGLMRSFALLSWS